MELIDKKLELLYNEFILPIYATKKSESEHNTEIRKQNYKSIF